MGDFNSIVDKKPGIRVRIFIQIPLFWMHRVRHWLRSPTDSRATVERRSFNQGMVQRSPTRAQWQIRHSNKHTNSVSGESCKISFMWPSQTNQKPPCAVYKLQKKCPSRV